LFDVDESIITAHHPTPSMSSDESISLLGGITHDGGTIKSYAASWRHDH
jgi:hypothetical protein